MNSLQARLVHKYQVVLSNGRHSFVADEPLSAQGTDLGPSPYELLLGSLAACKAMTVRMYAERKGWPLTGMEIEMSHQKVKSADYPQSTGNTPFVDVIEAKMRFLGDLYGEQIERLREISERCPVHRTLLGEIAIHSLVAETSA